MITVVNYFLNNSQKLPTECNTLWIASKIICNILKWACHLNHRLHILKPCILPAGGQLLHINIYVLKGLKAVDCTSFSYEKNNWHFHIVRTISSQGFEYRLSLADRWIFFYSMPYQVPIDVGYHLWESLTVCCKSK